MIVKTLKIENFRGMDCCRDSLLFNLDGKC